MSLFTKADRALLQAIKASRESSVDKAVHQYLMAAQLRGLVDWFVRVQVKGFKGKAGAMATNVMKGFPDWMGGSRGRFFVIEDKRPKGGVFKPEQVLWRDTLTRAGHLYIVARSVDDVKAALEGAA